MDLGILHGTTWYQATLNAGMYNETGGVISQDTSLVNNCYRLTGEVSLRLVKNTLTRHQLQNPQYIKGQHVLFLRPKITLFLVARLALKYRGSSPVYPARWFDTREKVDCCLSEKKIPLSVQSLVSRIRKHLLFLVYEYMTIILG